MTQQFFQTLTTAVGIALLCLSATHVRADAIDGDWCNAAGKQMTIRGPEIPEYARTPITGTSCPPTKLLARCEAAVQLQ